VFYSAADPKIWKGGGKVSVPSPFIANAHNVLYAYYTGKGGFLKTNMSQ